MKVAIIDEWPLFRLSIETIVKQYLRGEVGISCKGSEADRLLDKATGIDVLLIGVDSAASFETLQMAASRLKDARVVVLSLREERDHVVACLQRGAHGFVLRSSGLQDLVSAIRNVAVGQSFVPPELGAQFLRLGQRDGMRGLGGEANWSSRFTAREKKIISCVASGWTNKEIGAILGVSDKTIKYYLTAIMEKASVRNRTELAGVARENNLLTEVAPERPRFTPRLPAPLLGS